MNMTWLDFNDAEDVVSTEPERLDPAAIKTAIIDRLHSVVSYLFPNGKEKNNQFFVGDISGEAGKSLVIELAGDKAGVWNDFNTREKGDIFDAWAYHARLDCKGQFPQLLKLISEWLGAAPTHTRPLKPKSKSIHYDDRGPSTAEWTYHDQDGKMICVVYRFDPSDGKEFIVLDVASGKYRAPDTRLLYNLPGVAKSKKVVFVEGEKCALALIEEGITATTALFGSNAPIDKTDWSPLKGKDIVIWPDNDETGKKFANDVAEKLANIGARSVEVLLVPANKPAKWDAADAIAGNESAQDFIQTARTVTVKKKALELEDWLAKDLFIGKPKKREWLCEGIFPMAQVSLLAASGGVGKSFLLAKLAREVADFNGFIPTAPTVFGGRLSAKGAAIYITAEDDFIEMHLRLNSLGDIPDNLYVVPLSDAGGVKHLFVPDPARKVPKCTEFWESLVRQFKSIPDLRVIIIDPLQPLCGLDFNVPENAQFVCSKLSSLAAETGAAVIVSHHFAKREALTAEQAREAIRGSGGLVDGVRAAYALWQPPIDRAKSICKQLDCEYIRGGVVFGGVVKANGRANIDVAINVRDKETGILIDRSYELSHQKSTAGDHLKDLVFAISTAAVEGKPYTKTGQNGVHERRFEMPEVFHQFGRHKMIGFVDQLLSDKLVVTAMAPGQTSVKWLDEPEGPVAKGEAKFAPGHLSRSPSKAKA